MPKSNYFWRNFCLVWTIMTGGIVLYTASQHNLLACILSFASFIMFVFNTAAYQRKIGEDE